MITPTLGKENSILFQFSYPIGILFSCKTTSRHGMTPWQGHASQSSWINQSMIAQDYSKPFIMYTMCPLLVFLGFILVYSEQYIYPTISRGMANMHGFPSALISRGPFISTFHSFPSWTGRPRSTNSGLSRLTFTANYQASGILALWVHCGHCFNCQ